MKKKLRDVTREEYKKWFKKTCITDKVHCENCIFNKVNCILEEMDCWINHKDIFSDKFLDQEIEIEVEKPKPTKEEIIFLKMLRPEYKWITKDESGEVYIYTIKPKKCQYCWWFEDGKMTKLGAMIKSSFNFLSWEDEEPTNIQELIKEYEENE